VAADVSAIKKRPVTLLKSADRRESQLSRDRSLSSVRKRVIVD